MNWQEDTSSDENSSSKKKEISNSENKVGGTVEKFLRKNISMCHILLYSFFPCEERMTEDKNFKTSKALRLSFVCSRSNEEKDIQLHFSHIAERNQTR